MKILKPYRAAIDDLDDQIVDLLVKRTEIIQEVGHLKAEHGIDAVLQDRVDEVRERCARRAEGAGMDPEIIRDLYRQLIEYSCELEDGIIQKSADRQSA
ncbi:MAG: chorismate mutase [Pseudomonadota bacterium]